DNNVSIRAFHQQVFVELPMQIGIQRNFHHPVPPLAFVILNRQVSSLAPAPKPKAPPQPPTSRPFDRTTAVPGALRHHSRHHRRSIAGTGLCCLERAVRPPPPDQRLGKHTPPARPQNNVAAQAN